ncbi:MAG TPA: TIGR02466 family protein, partial [Gammaproteobacteria bacterium]|nr:TIGR02466 family protein [Gammaproteobacteria bacterium]
MSVDLFFGVPILVHDVEPAIRDAIHAKVAAYLDTDLAKRDVLPSPEESVATSYYKPEQSILADAELEELEQVVRAAASTFLEGRLGLPARQLEIERAWINVFEPGAQEGQHTHDGSLLSCSYYVEAPDDCGCIEFPDPIGERRGYRQFTRTVGSGLLTRPEIAVEPKPGRLVMFESWFGHSVQCNKSGKRRVSIAINLREAPAQARGSTGVTGAAAAGAVAGTGSAGTEAAGTEAAGTEAAGIEAARAAPSPAGAAGRPYLFNELFDVEMNLHLNVNPIQNQVP